MRKEFQDLYDSATNTALETLPFDLRSFFLRERLLGGASETKRFLDWPGIFRADLNNKANQQ